MPTSRHDDAAAERKRLRDRLAQQNLRNKRNKHIQELEQQVKLCRELHGDRDDRDLLRTVQALREENAALRERHRRVRAIFSSLKKVLDKPDSFDENDCDAPIQWKRGAFEAVQPKTPQELPPPESEQDTCNNAQEYSSAPTTSALMHIRAPPCTKPIKSPAIDYSVWLQDGDSNGARGVRGAELPSLYVSLDSRMTDAGCCERPVLHHTDPADAAKDVPGGVSQDQIEETKDTCYATFPTLHTDTRSSHTDLAHPDIATSLGHHDPFIDARLWNFMDLWAEKSVEDLPIWARIPTRTSTTDDMRYQPWDSNIRLILDSPDHPSPLDLLFGSNQNPLANSVQLNVKNYYYGDPERLAIGWLVYYFIKWRTQPSMERYTRLPNCLKPVSEQIRLPHPGCLDLIFWKRLRLNMMKNFDKYDIDKFMRLYCACLRLRWSRDEEVFVPNGEGKHILRSDFINHFMSESGWGLKAEFISHYPELFEGLDWEKIVYNVIS